MKKPSPIPPPVNPEPPHPRARPGDPGVCPVCDQDVAVGPAGQVAAHFIPKKPCPGAGGDALLGHAWERTFDGPKEPTRTADLAQWAARQQDEMETAVAEDGYKAITPVVVTAYMADGALFVHGACRVVDAA